MEFLPENKHLRIVLLVFYTALGAFLGYLFFKYIVWLLLPFLLAYFFAWMLEPIVGFLNKKLHVNRRLSSGISVIAFTWLLVTGIYAVVHKLAVEVQGLSVLIIDFVNELPNFALQINERLGEIFSFLPNQITGFFSAMITDLFSGNFTIPQSVSSGAVSFATNAAKAVPSAIIFVVVFMVATFFISSDRAGIRSTLASCIPLRFQNLLSHTQHHITSTLFKFLRAQLILMCITFIELFIGFSVLKLDYAFVLALSVALIDALPILGTGGVLIPWSVISLIIGNYHMAMGVIALYGVILLVRQILEPKIIGESIGLHPLVTLMSMYIGLNLIGFAGMIAGPITVILITFLYKGGYLDFLFAHTQKEKPPQTPLKSQ